MSTVLVFGDGFSSLLYTRTRAADKITVMHNNAFTSSAGLHRSRSCISTWFGHITVFWKQHFAVLLARRRPMSPGTRYPTTPIPHIKAS